MVDVTVLVDPPRININHDNSVNSVRSCFEKWPLSLITSPASCGNGSDGSGSFRALGSYGLFQDVLEEICSSHVPTNVPPP